MVRSVFIREITSDMKTKRYSKVNLGLCVLRKILNEVYDPSFALRIIGLNLSHRSNIIDHPFYIA